MKTQVFVGLAWMLAGQAILVTWRGRVRGETRSKRRNMAKFWGDDETDMMKYNNCMCLLHFLVLVENTCISSLKSLYDSGEMTQMTLVLASHLFGVRIALFQFTWTTPIVEAGKILCVVFLLPSFWSVPWFSKLTFLLTHRFACCLLLVRCFTIPMFPHIPTSLPLFGHELILLGLHTLIYWVIESSTTFKNTNLELEIREALLKSPSTIVDFTPQIPIALIFDIQKLSNVIPPNDTRWWFQRLCLEFSPGEMI